MSFDLDTLYNLLPAVYRRRDAQNQAIRGLLAVIQREVAVLEEDLAQRYDDEFIETCAEWVVPYIGDLLGVHGLHPIPDLTFSQRAYVANTISYRRRKGTVSVIERLARDVTGWQANAIEFFQVLAMTQNLNHQRLTSVATADLRAWEPLERVDTAFDSLAHTVDVRQIVSRRGRYNLPNVGVFLWRLKPFSLTDSPAVQVDAQRFLFSPFGNNGPLVTSPATETNLTRPVTALDVPAPISRRVLDANLSEYYGVDRSLLISVGGQVQPTNDIKVCDLSDVLDAGGAVIGWAHVPTPADDRIAVDPVLGRLAFATNQVPPPRVTFQHGFSYELGTRPERGMGLPVDAGAEVG